MTTELEAKHNEAMALVDQADAAQRRRDTVREQQLRHEAFLKEKEVALACAERKDTPAATLAILLCSAASLASETGQPREAERLIARALSGDPPHALAEVLRELWEKVRPQLRSLQAA